MQPAPRFDCEACRRSQLHRFKNEECQGIEWIERCPKNRVAKLTEENRDFWFLFERMLPGLCRPDGSFDFGAIWTVLAIYDIPMESRGMVLDRCLTVISLLRQKRTEGQAATTPQQAAEMFPRKKKK